MLAQAEELVYGGLGFRGRRVRRLDARRRVRHDVRWNVGMPRPVSQEVINDLDGRPAGAGAHRRAAIHRGMMLAGRGVLRGTLVMMFVPFHRPGRSRNGSVTLTMAWTGDFPRSQQLWDEEERGEHASGATIEHDGVYDSAGMFGSYRRLRYMRSISSSYIGSACSGPALMAEVAQCFKWFRMSSRPTPRSAS